MIRGEATNQSFDEEMPPTNHDQSLHPRTKAVASEASLTGESAPQMKDALAMEELRGEAPVKRLFSGESESLFSDEHKTAKGQVFYFRD